MLTSDHAERIAARVRQDNTLGLNICAAYLDLYDEVKRLRAELADGSFYKEVDIDRLQERAENAEAERDRVAAEWAETSQRNYQLAKAAEAERDALRAALDDARGLLVDAMVQLTDGKIKTRRNRALLIQDFLSRDKEQPE